MSEALYALATLACPVGMGAAMWLMMRHPKPSPGMDPREAEIARMRAELDQLQAAQRPSLSKE